MGETDTFPSLAGEGAWESVRQTANFQSNGPVTDVSSEAIRCYERTPGTAAPATTTTQANLKLEFRKPRATSTKAAAAAQAYRVGYSIGSNPLAAASTAREVCALPTWPSGAATATWRVTFAATEVRRVSGAATEVGRIAFAGCACAAAASGEEE